MDDQSDTPASPTRGPSTLDEIFSIHARVRPDAVALCDPPDRALFTDGAPRQLTYAEMDRAIAGTAARLRELDLPVGSAVGLQMPNTAEGVVAFLAVLRAGLIPAPLPLLWRRVELARALERIGARAVITCGRIGETDHTDLALHVAADTFSIRYVCGFGSDLLDGVVPLGDITSPSGSDTAGLQTSGRAEARSVAVITFDASADGPVPVPRTQAELLAGGLAVVLEAGLRPHGAMLGPMLLSSFLVLATTLIPWLLTGGTLRLHQPFDAAVFTDQVSENDYTTIVLPGPLVPVLATSGVIDAVPTRILALWRSPERQQASPRWAGVSSLIDILGFGELGIVPLRRACGEVAPKMALGSLRAPAGAADGTVIAIISRSAKGTLMLGGPMIPKQLWGEKGHAQALLSRSPSIDTGYACRIDPTTDTVILDAPPPGLVGIGGYRFALHELQELIGRSDPDSVLAALPDLLTGEKLAGAAADPAAMRAKLAALGLNPLLAEAFGDPVRAVQPRVA